MGKALSGSSAWRERVGLGHGWNEGAKLEVVQSSAAWRSRLLGRGGKALTGGNKLCSRCAEIGLMGQTSSQRRQPGWRIFFFWKEGDKSGTAR